MKTEIITTEDDIKTVLNRHWYNEGGIESVHFIMTGNWRDPKSKFDLIIIDKDGASLYKCPWEFHQNVYDEVALTKAKLFDYRDGRWLPLY